MKLEVGATMSRTHQITSEKVLEYTKLLNMPSPEEQQVVPVMLPAGLLSALLEAELPGANNLYRSQSLKFREPVRVGDAITTTIRITYFWDDIAQIDTFCTNQNGKTVLEGAAEVLIQQAEPVKILAPI